MLNDRFNNNSKFDLKDKFRDKKFVSAVAIGIFVLILFIVLIAKGCGSKKKAQPQQPQVQAVQPPPAPAVPAPATDYNAPEPPAQGDANAENAGEPDAQQLMREGRAYFNGDAGKAKNYRKAKECFVKAKQQGAKGADYWIKQCDKKLPRKTKTQKKRR